MPLPKTPASCYVLLMALAIATIPTTMAEPLCSDYDGKRRACKIQVGGCVWYRRKKQCLPAPSMDRCVQITTRFKCKKMGCEYDSNNDVCYLSKEANQREKDDNIETRPLFPDFPDRQPDEDVDFWGSLTGVDAELAMREIEMEFAGYYNVILCPKENADAGCLTRNLDLTRAKLFIDENNIVQTAIPDVPAPHLDKEVIDKPEDERTNSDPNREREVESKFWESLKGMEAASAMTEIEEEFGDYYRVYICPKENPDAECMLRNSDDRRVKLLIGNVDIVSEAIVG